MNIEGPIQRSFKGPRTQEAQNPIGRRTSLYCVERFIIEMSQDVVLLLSGQQGNSERGWVLVKSQNLL